MRNWFELKPSTLVLTPGEIASLRPKGRACRISCVTGRAMGDSTECHEDSVLVSGEEVTFTGRGRIVVEALRTATVLSLLARVTVSFAPFCQEYDQESHQTDVRR